MVRIIGAQKILILQLGQFNLETYFELSRPWSIFSAFRFPPNSHHINCASDVSAYLFTGPILDNARRGTAEAAAAVRRNRPCVSRSPTTAAPLDAVDHGVFSLIPSFKIRGAVGINHLRRQARLGSGLGAPTNCLVVEGVYYVVGRGEQLCSRAKHGTGRYGFVVLRFQGNPAFAGGADGWLNRTSTIRLGHGRRRGGSMRNLDRRQSGGGPSASFTPRVSTKTRDLMILLLQFGWSADAGAAVRLLSIACKSMRWRSMNLGLRLLQRRHATCLLPFGDTTNRGCLHPRPSQFDQGGKGSGKGGGSCFGHRAHCIYYYWFSGPAGSQLLRFATEAG